MGFSRQESWRGLPCPPPGDRTQVSYLSCTGSRFFTTSATWEAPGSLAGCCDVAPSQSTSPCFSLKDSSQFLTMLFTKLLFSLLELALGLCSSFLPLASSSYPVQVGYVKCSSEIWFFLTGSVSHLKLAGVSAISVLAFFAASLITFLRSITFWSCGLPVKIEINANFCTLLWTKYWFFFPLLTII